MSKRIIAIEVDDYNNNFDFYVDRIETRGSNAIMIDLRISGMWINVYSFNTRKMVHEWTMKDSVNHFLRLKGKEELSR